jgi:hypothetical protein
MHIDKKGLNLLGPFFFISILISFFEKTRHPPRVIERREAISLGQVKDHVYFALYIGDCFVPRNNLVGFGFFMHTKKRAPQHFFYMANEWRLIRSNVNRLT